MKNSKDYSTLLVWASCIVTVIRYSAAFYISDSARVTGILSEIISVFMGISGLGMGFLDVVGGAYIFEGWRKVLILKNKKNIKFSILTLVVFLTIINGIFILVPFTVSRVVELPIARVLGDVVWIWSIAINLAPYLIIMGAVLGNQGLVVVNDEQNTVNSSKQFAENLPRVTENLQQFTVNSPVRDVRHKSNLTEEDKEYIRTHKAN